MEITWKIVNCEHNVSDGLITVAHWRCDAQDGDLSAGVYGSVGLGEGTPTIPYNKVKESDVLGWVWASEGFDKDATEKQLADQIEALKAPKTESGLPW